jgi:hypothetical protein
LFVKFRNFTGWNASTRVIYSSDEDFALLAVSLPDKKAISYQGIPTKNSLGFLVENIFTYFGRACFNVIGLPLFDTSYSRILRPFMDQVAWLIQGLFGSATETKTVWERSVKYLAEVGPYDKETTIFTGHWTGGIIATAMAIRNGDFVINFESPEYNASLMAREHPFSDKDLPNLVNIYSGKCLTSSAVDDFLRNFRLPMERPRLAWVVPEDPYQVLCAVAAGCATTKKYDDFCAKTLENGMSDYLEYWESWGRSRQWY